MVPMTVLTFYRDNFKVGPLVPKRLRHTVGVIDRLAAIVGRVGANLRSFFRIRWLGSNDIYRALRLCREIVRPGDLAVSLDRDCVDPCLSAGDRTGGYVGLLNVGWFKALLARNIRVIGVIITNCSGFMM